MKNINPPCLMIAGTHSGVGKTLLTMGLTAAFREKGLTVQVFKVGPDYIDPSHHRVISGRPCFNLDGWMLWQYGVGANDGSPLQKIFQKGSVGADLCLVEGVMGLFDGFGSTSDEGSSAEIAKLFDIPVLLVLDGSAMARSAAAIVQGFTQFDPGLKFAGVILNNVGGEKHAVLLKEAIESSTKVPVLGWIPKDKNLEIPERHLGLVPAQERDFQSGIGKVKELILRYCDFNKIQQSAAESVGANDDSPLQRPLKSFSVRIAYGWDEAFHFYYQDNLDFLQELGAEMVPFSPIHDVQLPDDIHALYFGGGFPEVFAKELQANVSMQESIHLHSAQAIPIYAECGGLMYLSEGITDLEGKFHRLLGIIPGKITMTDCLQNFGYQQARLLEDCWMGNSREIFRAHEFHYSKWDGGDGSPAYSVKAKYGGEEQREGYLNSHILASYLHLHFLSVPRRGECFVTAAKEWQRKRKEVMANGTRS